MEAIQEQDLDLLTEILANQDFRSSIDLNHKYDNNGNTLVHEAIEVDFPKGLDLLIQEGVDCNVFNHRKVTCLHLAAQKCQYDSLWKLLYQGGAEINSATEDGETILHILARKCAQSNTKWSL